MVLRYSCPYINHSSEDIMKPARLFGISLFMTLVLNVLGALPASAQSFTFDLDEVEPATSSIGLRRNGQEIARQLRQDEGSFDFNATPWEPQILTNSFADTDNLFNIGEDVLFQMLLKAFCKHRPVVLTPDAIWLVICQQVSYCVNNHPEGFRPLLVKHDGKKELVVKCEENLFSDNADWPALISGFTSQIAKYTNNNIAATLVADFSTTGLDERIASEVTLMDVVKPFFEYTATYAACGIPSITIKGTPEDWRKVLEKTQALDAFGFDWWTSELEPILQEFIAAAEGHPDYWFWKDIVLQTRPKTIQGPSCGRHSPPLTEFDGWFLKFFPFDNEGRMHETVTITQTMLPETVVVPFKYQVVAGETVLSETPMELVAGIVGVTEDPDDFTLTPKIGWIARTARPEAQKGKERETSSNPFTMESSFRYWDEGPLSFDHFSKRESELPQISTLDYGITWNNEKKKIGNTVYNYTKSRTFMNPYASWIHPDYEMPSLLQYFQTSFDYVEICRRRAQNEFANSSSYSYHDIRKFHLDVAESFIARMKDDTQQGTDATAVRYYAARVEKELASTEEQDPFDPLIYPRGFAVDLHAGAGSEVFLNPSHVNTLVGAVYGLDLAVNRLVFTMDYFYGRGGKNKKDIFVDGYAWKTGDLLCGGSANIKIGYTVYDSQWWSVTPSAGIGAGFLTNRENRGRTENNDDEISGLRIQAGVSVGYKFFRTINDSVLKDSLSEFSIKTRFFVARNTLPAMRPLWSVNFGIDICWQSWVVHKR